MVQFNNTKVGALKLDGVTAKGVGLRHNNS